MGVDMNEDAAAQPRLAPEVAGVIVVFDDEQAADRIEADA
jgi:hypothetical protein